MQNKFSYPLKLEDMSSTPKEYHLVATAEQLQYIAHELKLNMVKSFQAVVSVEYSKAQHTVWLKGKISSEVEHTSVVSLRSFIRPYKIDFALYYDTQMTYAQLRELEDFGDINADIPEIMENGYIDLALVAMEQLAAELDDFPRIKGEKFTYQPDFDPDDDKPANPFEVLKKLAK